MADETMLQSTSDSQRRWYQKGFVLPNGLRLLLAFQVLIVLTALIGFLAVQRFSSLTNNTAELNIHDLPEVILLVDLRGSLFQQRRLVRTLVESGLSSQERQSTQVQLEQTLKQISEQHARLLTLETTSGQHTHDSRLMQQLAQKLSHHQALSQQIQVLVNKNQFAQARTFEQQHYEPLMQSTLDVANGLLRLSQQEANDTSALVQQESHTATILILVLTVLALTISLVFAFFFTRSLTRPISLLLSATGAIASGNLDVALQLNGRDEFGRLATAFDEMRVSLRATIARLVVERQQTQAILDTSPDGIVLVDAERIILQCNPAAGRFSGWRTEEVIGRHCWEVFGCWGSSPQEAEAHERVCPLQTVLSTDARTASTEMQVCSHSGKLHWLAVSCASLIQDERTREPHLVVDIHDISQLKAVEELKTDFVALVSHELPAPLPTVSGSASIWPSSSASYKLAQLRSKNGENDNSGKLSAAASLESASTRLHRASLALPKQLYIP